MNEDLYDTGSAVVGLYRLFTNFLKFPGEFPGLGGSIGGRVLGITGPSPSCPSFFLHLFQLKLFEISLGGTIPETGEKTSDNFECS